ncbi:hypothetical protein C4D60_Mb04t16260 [Musa balbisiana]|uniref:Non-haem dioxygenase N-terminal domain-containing protein n=1 Tax=Musa balbisiana TaxID=52838 RepID=A0A4S8KCE8_MUSBA|nr:hypothetical protein C4D60_Mb04t16260 [Musa balbisiana]
MALFSAQQRPALDHPFLSSRSPSVCRAPLRVSMAAEPVGAFPTARTVTISYSDIKEKSRDLSMNIEEGFGPNGLGIISVSDVPGVARLPDDVKKELEDPESRYNFGWSHGKEKLEYPSYCRPNKWPATSLPELEEAFKALGMLMMEVGLMLAYHCDQYVSREMKDHENGSLEQILKQSRCHKGRLLYYFPKELSHHGDNNNSISSWCGWHTDHGSLTVTMEIIITPYHRGVDGILTMVHSQALPVACLPEMVSRYLLLIVLLAFMLKQEMIRVVFGEDEIAYQIGETTEILGGGYLCATPHCVQKLMFSGAVPYHQELILPHGTLTFGEFSERLLNKYYHEVS